MNGKIITEYSLGYSRDVLKSTTVIPGDLGLTSNFRLWKKNQLY